ncbi:hypothetical protein BDV96DRAFT_240378 [Lophiotrema nucula]|uniref:Ubiquitin-like domain-containing protein n=1 Tax=Lophiotrema nucula TaxID=690887 RepID=A0A6A5YRV2_9PLEO|nr:hypothetical protein BDV96DRAFT_240378 [Lophiotrema nucula]
MRQESSTSKVKVAWMKIRWTMCKSEDVLRFKTDIAAHTQCLLILLAALQVKLLRTQDSTYRKQAAAFGISLQAVTRECISKLSMLLGAIRTSIDQGQRLLEATMQIWLSNIQIFHMTRAIYHMLGQMPYQVERQQPVYMIDALGKVAPFRLEFIRSQEALKAVLNFNFKKIPSGLRKIENGESLFRDRSTGRFIDMTNRD